VTKSKATQAVDLSKHMVATYKTLRIILVIIAVVFPLVLLIGGKLTSPPVDLQPSISDYYHANSGVLRNWFVGVLFAVAGLLAVYKGYRPAEDRALDFAAVCAVGVALVPNTYNGILPFHYIFAICFFLSIAYVCIFCASATLSLVTEKKRSAFYKRFYYFLATVMVVSPLVAGFIAGILRLGDSYIFVAEFFAIYAFAAYWLVKTFEINETNADTRAASGELELAPGKGPSDAVTRLPVVSKSQPVAVNQAR
jgi:hypothetical protein